MLLASSSIILRHLSSQGRLILSGDTEQLPPISCVRNAVLQLHRIHGSILDCFIPPHGPKPPNVIQLTENFRLNPDLSDFISTIYPQPLRSQKLQSRELASLLASLSVYNTANYPLEPLTLINAQYFLITLSRVITEENEQVQDLRSPEIKLSPATNSATSRWASLTLMKLNSHSRQAKCCTYEAQVELEVELAVSLVVLLKQCAPHYSIFVVTPHRFQRESVKRRIRSIASNISPSDIVIETVERLQGSEADFVICLFSSLHPSSSHFSFLLERRRLNVAISRTKMVSIVISSDEVLKPTSQILVDEGLLKGFTFLKAYEKRAWTWDFLPKSRLLSYQ
ncbi:hypothetical protein GALMADRAFT_60592 [Galerina marginata CBS 339.88]|uniref:DNA2/NAM7 helicase-like C-terminal domain-containing protein n=1 Tax=Galerina marginata (strain CBS 339.88) TaxID=685588 RepID=A0A067TD47_GALM3|nr:hypothetical protein GALMADRAFT_60592 [Galerina marginata CBS 339.88]